MTKIIKQSVNLRKRRLLEYQQTDAKQTEGAAETLPDYKKQQICAMKDSEGNSVLSTGESNQDQSGEKSSQGDFVEPCKEATNENNTAQILPKEIITTSQFPLQDIKKEDPSCSRLEEVDADQEAIEFIEDFLKKNDEEDLTIDELKEHLLLIDKMLAFATGKDTETYENEIDRELEAELLTSQILENKVKALETFEINIKCEIVQELIDKIEKLQNLSEALYDNYPSTSTVSFAKRSSTKAVDKTNACPISKLQEPLARGIETSCSSTSVTQKQKQVKPKMLVVIGPNGTTVDKTALESINWSLSGAAITRKLLVEVFDREELAFHNLTGKPSPAFMDCKRPTKSQLNPLKVADIMHFIMKFTCLTAKEVRHAITTKCADENKMFRQKKMKRPGSVSILQKKPKL